MPVPSSRESLLTLLSCSGRGIASGSGGDAGRNRDRRIRQLIEELERDHPADLSAPGALDLLKGVWDLRWSDGSQPYLMVASWLENLQLLDPEQGRGMNLLRLAGPLGPLGGIAVQARISLEAGSPCQRVRVQFERGGWLGPMLAQRRLQLLREVKQSFPAWLDITVLDQELRVCRGNAGTLFALLRRSDLAVNDLLA